MTATRYGGKRQKKHSKAKRTQRRRQKGGTVDFDTGESFMKHLIDTGTGTGTPSQTDAKNMLVSNNILSKSWRGVYTFNAKNIDDLKIILNKIKICTDTQKIEMKLSKGVTTEYGTHMGNTLNKKFKLDPYLYANRFNEMVTAIVEKISVGGVFAKFINQTGPHAYKLTNIDGLTIVNQNVNRAYFLYLLLKDFIKHSTIVNGYYIINTVKLNQHFSNLIAAIQYLNNAYLEQSTVQELEKGIKVSPTDIQHIIQEMYYLIANILLSDANFPMTQMTSLSPNNATLKKLADAHAGTVVPNSNPSNPIPAPVTLSNIVSSATPTPTEAVLVYVGLTTDTTNAVIVDDKNIYYDVIPKVIDIDTNVNANAIANAKQMTKYP